MNNNYVLISGTIVHIFDTQRGCAIVTVKTGSHAFPSVVFLKEMAQKVLSEYQVGMQIGVEGYLISSVIRKGKTQSVIAANFLSEVPDEPKNIFRLEGVALKCWMYDKFCVVHLLVEQDGHICCIPVSLQLTVSDGRIPKGTRIRVGGHISTRVDYGSEEPRYYQNYYGDRLLAA